MLNFIIGRSGCGKTTFAHSLLGEFAKKGESTVLIVPKQFTFESDRGVLDTLGPLLATRVDVLSFTRLADVVFKATGKVGKPILKDTASAVMMSLALGALEEKLSFFARHRNSVAFSKKMLCEVARFKKEAIEPEDIFSAAQKLPDGLLKKRRTKLHSFMKHTTQFFRKAFLMTATFLPRFLKDCPKAGFLTEKLLLLMTSELFPARR